MRASHHLTRIAVAGALSCAIAAGAAAGRDLSAADEHWSMLNDHCVQCHNFEDWAGGVAFDLMSPEAIPEDAEVWEAAIRKLRGNLMPPPGEPQPAPERALAFVEWLEGVLDSAAAAHPHVGHVPAQRLSATQYATVVKGLLDVDVDADAILPTEVEVDGFDNVAAALTVSPAFLEQYLAAARNVARLAVGDPEAKVETVFYPAPQDDQLVHVDGMPLGTRGSAVFPHVFPADGEYRVTVLGLDIGVYTRVLESRQTVLVLLDGEEVFRADVGGPEEQAWADRNIFEAHSRIMERFADIPIQVTAGRHEIAIAFVERARAATEYPVIPSDYIPFDGSRQRMPKVTEGVEIRGPYGVAGVSMSPSRERIFVCYPEAAAEEEPCAREIVSRLARRAFRRPVTEDDIESIMPFYSAARAEGATFDTGVEDALAAILSSAHFLYRVIEPPAGEEGAPVYALDDLELASRLSFFLWSQGPDEELLALAESGALSDPEIMEGQVQRMLADPRAETLVTDFALKWLNLDDLDAVDPNGAAFPFFSTRLREDFAAETRLFLSSILLEDRSVVDILRADHTYLNEPLARHYGIPGVGGDRLRQVALGDESRWGILGKSAVLLRTSYGDRTSPVLRGAWVLEKLLGTPPAPPPPGVDTNLAIKEGEPAATVRERLERHRGDPSCNGCHGVIDPWGLALENFDVTGRWRDIDIAAEQAIDPTATLSSGEMVAGPADLRRALEARSELFVRNLTEKLMMYALGRELEHYDMPQVRAIVRAAAEDDYTLASIVKGIVASPAFRMQANPDAAAPEDDLATTGAQ